MDKDRLIAVLQSDPRIQAAVLFGSQAAGYADENSDIDVAVLYASSPDPIEKLKFQELLSEEMKQQVDLVSLNEASPILAMQVVKNGSLLYVLDPRAYAEFEVRLITDYADLKRLLEPFEKSLLERDLHDR